MAIITSKAVTGNLSTGANWVGDVVPVNDDTIVIVSGADITIDQNITLGSKASGVGHAFNVAGASALSYGILRVAAAVEVTLKGYDLTSNTLGLINRYGKFIPAATAIINFDGAAGNSTALINNGHLHADGATFSTLVANINWNNDSGAQTITSLAFPVYDYDTSSNSIGVIKLKKGAVVDPGPISNAAGSGLGSFGDSSIIITSQTNGPVTEVSSFSSISSTGDYYVDYPKGLIYYKGYGNLSLSYSFKHATWPGAGIQAAANTSGSSITIINCIINRIGSQYASLSETSGAAILARYKFTTDADRVVLLTGNTFNYCTRCIQVYNATTDSSHYLNLSGNTFNDCRYSADAYDGIFAIGYSNYWDINDNTFDSFSTLLSSVVRGTMTNIYVRNNTGFIDNSRFAYTGCVPTTVQDNVFSGFGALLDSAGFAQEGLASGNINYLDNYISHGNRSVRLGNYMTVTGNTFDKSYHHGVVARSTDGYLTGSTIKNNRITKSKYPTDSGGGWALGYNKNQWIDDIEISNNDFDSSVRTIMLNEQEETIVIGTRLKIFNNNLTNSVYGITRPVNSSNNISKLSIDVMDYNNDFNNTNASNIKQATFIAGGEQYNLSATKNILGVSLFGPTASLPQTSGKTLQLVKSGTFGTDKSITLSWGGGTAVESIVYQGTATGGTTSTLVKTGSGWTVNAYRAMYLYNATTGTFCMIKSNTTDTLTLIPNNTAGTLIAPANGDVFAIIDPEMQLSDGTNTVQAGIYLPALPLSTGTISDENITIETHAVALNPEYLSPGATNMSLVGVGYGGHDGGYIGALPPIPAGKAALIGF